MGSEYGSVSAASEAGGRTRHKRWKRVAATAGGVAVAALLAAGCGASDSPGGGSATATQAAAGGSPLGPSKVATGRPILLGSVNEEGGAGGSYPMAREAMQAAVSYVNEHLGGVHGRPLQIKFCNTTGDPAASAACANRVVNAHPVAMLGAVDLGSPGSIPVVRNAGLPWIGGSPPSQQIEMDTPNGVQFFPSGSAIYSANAAYAVKALGAKSAAIINYTIPPAEGVANAAADTLRSLGVTKIARVPVAISNPDRAPAVAAATADQPDAVIVTEGGATCVSLMQAMRQLAPSTKLMMAGACSDARTLKAAGAASEGVLFADAFDPISADTPDMKVYLAAMAEYAPETGPDHVFAKAGFSTVVNTWRTLNEMPAGDLSPQAILQAFRSGRDHPNFLSHPYTCDGSNSAGRALCNEAARMIEIRGGKPVAADDNWYGSSGE